MPSARISGRARWRALLVLAWRAARWKAALFAALMLVSGLLPTGIIVATGALVRAIPAAVAHGLADPGARPALVALAAMTLGLVTLSLLSNAVVQLSRVVDHELGHEVHRSVARATLLTPTLAALEDPALADHLYAVHEIERRGVLRITAWSLSNVVSTRVRGLGAFALLLGFRWWAPLVLAAAWHLTNRVYLQATENGVTVDMDDGAVRLRRAEYLRSLAVEAPAAKEVRVFGLGGWVVGRYADAWLAALDVMWRSRRANRALTAAAVVALAASHAAVLGALGLASTRGEVGAAALLVFVQAVIATADLGMIGDYQWSLAQSLAAAERVAQVEARAADREGSYAPPSDGAPAATAPAARVGPGGTFPLPRLPQPRGGGVPAPEAAIPAGGALAVRLHAVRFAYRGRERPTLDGLSLEIPAGQSVAVVGENGAGKTTLIKLLCGLYEPDAGEVVVGGQAPLRARRRIAAIFQDFVRYKLPLRENVGFGRLALMGDDGALAAALADAGGGALPALLPGGWDTVLSREFDGGAELSGGQWQRVALARAFAAVRGGAGLLILDEPTASLDVRAETELFERFLRLTRGVTTILVSHRLSSVRNADRIVVLDGGRVAEDGTHDALMAAGGLYARMFARQAERFADEDGGGDHGDGGGGAALLVGGGGTDPEADHA